MPELNDDKLLAEFASNGSETAFTALVERYVNLVYSAALRFTGNPHHAAEISQAVFIILARKAGKLSPRVVLSGWLYQAVRLTSANFLKSERRRQLREQEVFMQSILTESNDAAWNEIAPLLDEAMGQLGETDRNAVVMRFFENKTAAEVAAKLKLTEAAAHKRMNRALEKLRKIFAKRGVNSTTPILAGTISVHSVQAAPIGLAKTISTVAITKGSAASVSTLTLIKGALKIMAWTKAKTAVFAGVCVLLLAGTGVVTIVESQKNRGPSGKLSQDELEQENPVEHYVLHTPLTQTGDQLRNALVGKWMLVGAKSIKSGKFVVLDSNNHFFKTFTLTNWATINYDSNSNVVNSAGGPFSLHGEVSTETIETATGSKSEFLGAHVPFRIRVVGDDYYQMGAGSPASVEQQWHRISE